ncbi:hypothetical protein ACRRTK_021773 [Alexandromys fortis]
MAWVSHRIQILWSEWVVQSPQTWEQPESLVSECPRGLKGRRSENQQGTETVVLQKPRSSMAHSGAFSDFREVPGWLLFF